MLEKREKEIDINKKYSLPNNLSVVRYKDKIIIISVDTANWIILDNEQQYTFFNLLKEYTIQSAIDNFEGSIVDIQQVLIQLEAKDFENTHVMLKDNITAMHFYLTNSCNMKCPHCYMYAGIAKEGELNTTEVFDALSGFKNNGGELVTFSGGEISVRKDLIEIIKYAYSIGLKVELLTNGTLWNKTQIEEVAPLIFRVQVSIDGYSEQTNAKVRGKGNFYKALETVDLFLMNGARVDVGITPWFDSDFIENYGMYVDFAQSLLNKYVGLPITIKFNSDLLDGRELKLTEEEKKEYENIVQKINYLCFGDIEDVAFVEFHKLLGIENNCSFGNISIGSNGDVFFCAVLPVMKKFANVRNTDFGEIMELSRKARLITDANHILPCKGCELKYICGGDCRIKFFSNIKDLDIRQDNIQLRRKCNQNIKNSFYDIMITTNHKLFR